MSDMDEARELYNRYAVNWDENRPQEVGDCFTPDAVLTAPNGAIIGREAIKAVVKRSNISVGTGRQFHLTTNVSVKLDGDRGTGAAYYIYHVVSKEGVETTAYGTYRDEFLKIEGRWYLSARTARVEAGRMPSA